MVEGKIEEAPRGLLTRGNEWLLVGNSGQKWKVSAIESADADTEGAPVSVVVKDA